MLARNAQDEMLKRIRQLDAEESHYRATAARYQTEADDYTRKAEQTATRRRQYEYAVGQLDGDPNLRVPVRTPAPLAGAAPSPSERVVVPVTRA